MDKKVCIRTITMDDTGDILRIAKAISEDGPSADLQKSIDHITKSAGDGVSVVAEIDGRIVGYMISNILYAGFGLKKSAWIVTIGVDPDLMGQGIGKKMAREIFEEYKNLGISHVYSSVLWDSVDVLSFFKTLGFERSSFINLRKEL